MKKMTALLLALLMVVVIVAGMALNAIAYRSAAEPVADGEVAATAHRKSGIDNSRVWIGFVMAFLIASSVLAGDRKTSPYAG